MSEAESWTPAVAGFSMHHGHQPCAPKLCIQIDSIVPIWKLHIIMPSALASEAATIACASMITHYAAAVVMHMKVQRLMVGLTLIAGSPACGGNELPQLVPKTVGHWPSSYQLCRTVLHSTVSCNVEMMATKPLRLSLVTLNDSRSSWCICLVGMQMQLTSQFMTEFQICCKVH